MKGHCRAKTVNGTPCKRACKPKCRYCWQHQSSRKQKGGDYLQQQQYQPQTQEYQPQTQEYQPQPQTQPQTQEYQPQTQPQQYQPQTQPQTQPQSQCLTTQELQMILQQCGLCTGKDVSKVGSTIGATRGLVSSLSQATPAFLSAFKDIKGFKK